MRVCYFEPFSMFKIVIIYFKLITKIEANIF